MAFTTWSPTDLLTTTISGGNLTATSTGTLGYVRAIDKKLAGSGKFYWEVQVSTWLAGNTGVGYAPSALSNPNGSSGSGFSAVYHSGNIYVSTTQVGSFGLRNSGDIIGVAQL
jgi:hypothetical protein